MAKDGFRRNSKTFREILTGPEIQARLNERAESAAARANNMMGPKPERDIYGYRAYPRSNPKNRAAAHVATGGWTSRRDNARNNTLNKSIGG